jgi:hypothetical protein
VSHTLDAVVNDELTTSSPLPTNVDGKARLLTEKVSVSRMIYQPHLSREFRIYHGPSLLREGNTSFPQCLVSFLNINKTTPVYYVQFAIRKRHVLEIIGI